MKLQEQYYNHPDFNKVIYDGEYVDRDGLKELADSICETRKQFYRIALPVMIRDTGANKIQEEITFNEGPIQDDGSQRVVTKWSVLQDNPDLHNEAWAHIGKELTFRLFNEVHNEENRGCGRPKKLSKDKHVHIARQVLKLKRALYEL